MDSKRKKPSLASILTDYLKSKRGETVHGGELEYVAKANGHEAEPGKVRLREMTRPTHPSYNQFIEKVKLKDGCVAYRWIGPDPQKDPSHFRCQYCPAQAVAFTGEKPRCIQHQEVLKPASLFS